MFPTIQKVIEKVWTVIKPIVSGIGTVIGGISSGIGWIADKLGVGSGDGKAGNNATGTQSWRGGMTWVGEHGPELMALPKGTRITSNQQSKRQVRKQEMIAPSRRAARAASSSTSISPSSRIRSLYARRRTLTASARRLPSRLSSP